MVVVTVFFLQESKILKEELRKKKINALNSGVVVWKISHYKNDPSVLTTFPVHEK